MTWNKISILIIEDEPAIQQMLAEKLDESEHFSVSGTADSVDIAFSQILSLNPDAVFLDIKLIGGTAFQLLDKLAENRVFIPPVIINTGFAEFEFAQRIFNEYRDSVVMILQKPFWENWEEKVVKCYDAIIAKLNTGKDPRHQMNFSDGSILIRSGNHTYQISSSDLCYIEVGGGGTSYIVTHKEQLHIKKTMSQLLALLPDNITQISRFVSVNIHCIHHIDHGTKQLFLHQNKNGFSIGKNYYERIKSLL